METGEFLRSSNAEKQFRWDIFLWSFVRQSVWRNKTIWWPPRTFVPAIWSRRKCNWFFNSVCPSMSMSISVSGVTWNEMSFTWIAVGLNYFWFQFHTQNICVCVCSVHNIEFHSSQINWSGDLYFFHHLCFRKCKMKNEMNSVFIEARFLQLNHLFKAENPKFVCMCVCVYPKKRRIWCSYFVYHIHNWHHT